MSTHASSMAKRRDWRRIIFTVFASIVAFFLLTNLFRLAAPWASMAWYPHDDPRQLNPDLHRWHEAMWGAVTGILEGGVLLTLILRPRQNPLLMQFMALALVGAILTVLPFEPGLLFVIVIMTLVVITYPMPRALLDFSHEGPISRPLLGLSLAAALVLAPYMVRLMVWQIRGVGGEHAVANQWAADVEHAAFLLLAMFLASMKRAGWQTLGVLTGVVLLYLGMAALALPNHAGSWGAFGGVAALIGGVLYLIAMLSEIRKTTEDRSKALSASASS